MSGISWKTDVGINHVGAYQVSGRPFASGSINASTAVKVEFPKVTRWIYVVNHGSTDCRIGFSQAGVEGTNFIRLGPENGSAGTQHTARLELKISEVWFSGSSNIDVAAGLTNINTDKVSGSIGPSWSGSAGVG